MNNGIYNTPNEPQKSRAGLPRWFWLITVVGLLVSVLAGYISGSNFGKLLSSMNIEDTNGEDTSLCSLNFTQFLGVYDGIYGYNRYDSEASCILYDTSRQYDATLEVYSNEFKSANTDQNSTFFYLNYYDVCFVHELSSPKTLTVSFSSKLQKGNLEGRLIHVSSDFKVEIGENDIPIIKDEYITSLASFGANAEKEITLNVPESGLLIFVVGGECAVGSYNLKIS